MTLLDQIKVDREAGTPGPWRVNDCESFGDRCKTFYQEVWNDETDILVTTEVTRAHNDGGRVNIRRIARVPDMEAALLAAGELADKLEAMYAQDDGALLDSDFEDLMAALAAFRSAIEVKE